MAGTKNPDKSKNGKLSKTARKVAASDHPGYFGSLMTPHFATYGDSDPFGQYMATTALADVEQGYTNKIYQRPKLRFDRYLQNLGMTRKYSPLAPIGTGQAADTGNPFTSSSGIGGGVFSDNLAGAQPGTVDTGGGSPFARLGGNRPGVPQGPGAGPGKMTRPGGKQGFDKRQIGPNYYDQLRRDWLSLSPMERGEVGLGKTAVPGRWSPWG
jgi:hypothetical protein